ncbi:HU family DNA-binding protein [Desulfohalovibrio reitneri]|uniref:HU family DNA-binding protein n=1 Tax=Desulfohalovibrio reitneri TaxID=1307759 RepID=UPI0004A6D383|nr:HU family DNA-binding protein [Desulfohalovibrio reitneri]
MNKGELITRVSDMLSISNSEAERAVSGTLEAMEGALAKGDKVTLTDFGTFEVKQRAGRTGRNPQTGEAVEIAPKRVVTFRPGKGLRAAVNEK